MLARSLATGLAAADNAAVAVGELAQQVEILVVDKHRTGTFAIDANGILLGNLLVAATAAGGLAFVVHKSRKPLIAV